MTLVGLTFIFYSLYGNYLPDVVLLKGFSVERMVRFQIFTNAGLFGAPLGIAAGAVFGFVLFGAFLQTTGAGKFLLIYPLLLQDAIEEVLQKQRNSVCGNGLYIG